MDGVKCTYVLTNSGQRQPGSSFSLFNGGNICSYYFERAATSYSITYNKNCNDTVSNMPSAQSGSTTASSITLSGNRPTRSGYEFQGWSTSSGSTAAQYQPGGSYSLSNGTSRTLYAVWKQTQKYQLTVETLVDNVKVGEGTAAMLMLPGPPFKLPRIKPNSIPTRSHIPSRDGA